MYAPSQGSNASQTASGVYHARELKHGSIQRSNICKSQTTTTVTVYINPREDLGRDQIADHRQPWCHGVYHSLDKYIVPGNFGRPSTAASEICKSRNHNSDRVYHTQNRGIVPRNFRHPRTAASNICKSHNHDGDSVYHTQEYETSRYITMRYTAMRYKGKVYRQGITQCIQV